MAVLRRASVALRLLFVAAAIRLLFVAMVSSTVVSRPMVPAIFVFGDSTADVGNNNNLPGSSARADFPHNGIDFPGGEPTGRFSNGFIGADFLAVHMGFSGSPPPYLSLVAANSSGGEGLGNTTKKPVAAAAFMRGASFASGGSGVLDSTGDTINMTKQIEYFSDLKDQMLTARLGAFGASAFLSKSIFLISAGSNDAIDFFSQDTSPDSTALQQFREAVVSTYDSHVKTLYNLGARKFAVIDVAPLGCCPYWRSRNPAGECVEPLNRLAKSLNDGLQDLFAGLSSEMHGMEYAIGSSYELVSSIVQDPQSAGLTELKSACCGGGGRFNADGGCTPSASYCGDRGKFLFWDFLHPTQATSRLAGRAFYDGPARFVGPITFRELAEA
uniref:GDSL esterase/lipase n=1 Tax=Hordeum vulgare subsp. vulgare TaxID=112509 RepID=A0A8I6Y206_HORVV